MEQPSIETRELSTGYIIVGAYADKVRKTLFAQLKDLSKQDKEFSREIARASAELNVVLYRILVDELKADKGDVIRARVSYTVDPRNKRIRWDYKSLRLELFRRVPDEQVSQLVNEIVQNKLSKILEEYRLAPREAEEAIKAFEVTEEQLEAQRQPVPLPAPVIKPGTLIGSVDILGETVYGGLLLKISDKEGRSKGLATVTPSGDEIEIDAIIIHEGSAKRYLGRVKGALSVYRDNPGRLVSDLDRIQPTELSREQADSLIREKMFSMV